MKKILVIVLSLMLTAVFMIGCEGDRTVRDDLPPRPQINLPAATANWSLPYANNPAAIGGTHIGNHLRIGTAQADRVYVERMMQRFTQQYAPQGFQFTMVIIEEDQARAEIQGSPNPADSADVVSIVHDQLGPLVDGGFISGISAEATPGLANVIRRNTLGAVHASMAYTGYVSTLQGEVNLGWRHYGFPYAQDTHFLVYNRNRIQTEEDRALLGTFDGIVELGRRHNVARPFGMDVANGFYSMNFFLSYGVRLFGEHGIQPGNVGFDTPEALQSMNFLYSNRNHIQNISPITAPTQLGLLGDNILTFITGPYRLDAFRGAVAGGNVGIRPLPRLVTGATPAQNIYMYSNANYKLYVVNARTQNRPLAMQVAAFLANPVNQVYRTTHRDFMPTDRYMIANNTTVATHPLIQVLADQFNRSVTIPSIAELARAWAPVGNLALRVVNGETPTAESLRTLNNTIRYP